MIVGCVFADQAEANTAGDWIYDPQTAFVVFGSVKMINTRTLIEIASVNGVAFGSVRLIDGLST